MWPTASKPHSACSKKRPCGKKQTRVGFIVRRSLATYRSSTRWGNHLAHIGSEPIIPIANMSLADALTFPLHADFQPRKIRLVTTASKACYCDPELKRASALCPSQGHATSSPARRIPTGPFSPERDSRFRCSSGVRRPAPELQEANHRSCSQLRFASQGESASFAVANRRSGPKARPVSPQFPGRV